VPGLLAAKIGQALMLPVLSAQRENHQVFVQRYIMMLEGISIGAATYLVAFIVAGGTVLPLAFGPNYVGLDMVLGWLAAMWALRMMQAVPGIALMAMGDTRPLLTAGMIRASALGLAWAAVSLGLGLPGVAAAGVAGELASVVYVAIRTGRDMPGITRITIVRTLYPLAAGAAAALCVSTVPLPPVAWIILVVGMVLAVSAILAGIAVMPTIRAFVEGELSLYDSASRAAANPPATDPPYAATQP
jgi:O-antigen/teichoic acid export membrane protein